MRPLALIALLLPAAPAAAHTGHIGALAGHDHWVAGTAIGLAVAVGVWGLLKGRREEPAEQADETETDAETEEAEA